MKASEPTYPLEPEPAPQAAADAGGRCGRRTDRRCRIAMGPGDCNGQAAGDRRNLPVELQHGVPERDPVTGPQDMRGRDPLTIDERAVGGAEVLDKEIPIVDWIEARVPTGDLGVLTQRPGTWLVSSDDEGALERDTPQTGVAVDNVEESSSHWLKVGLTCFFSKVLGAHCRTADKRPFFGACAPNASPRAGFGKHQ